MLTIHLFYILSEILAQKTIWTAQNQTNPNEKQRQQKGEQQQESSSGYQKKTSMPKSSIFSESKTNKIIEDWSEPFETQKNQIFTSHTNTEHWRKSKWLTQASKG